MNGCQYVISFDKVEGVVYCDRPVKKSGEVLCLDHSQVPEDFAPAPLDNPLGV